MSSRDIPQEYLFQCWITHLVFLGCPVDILDDELTGEAAGTIDDKIVLGHRDLDTDTAYQSLKHYRK